MLSVTVSVSPRLYPDELIFSFLARYKALLEYQRDSSVLRDFYGDRHVSICLTGHVPFGKESTNLPGPWLGSDEAIIQNHTLAPIYVAFQNGSTLIRYRKLIEGGKGLSHSPWLRRLERERRVLGLAYCPDCIEEDHERFGESYWRRVHNLYGVFVCPQHDLHLERLSAEPVRHGVALALPPRPDELTRRRPVNHEKPAEAILSSIAKDLAQLFCDRDVFTARRRAADAVRGAVRAGALDHLGHPSIEKTTRVLFHALSPEAVSAFRIRQPQRQDVSWFERFTSRWSHLEPVAVAVALRVLNSSLGEALSAEPYDRSQGRCLTSKAKGKQPVRAGGTSALGGLGQNTPIGCAPQLIGWLQGTVAAPDTSNAPFNQSWQQQTHDVKELIALLRRAIDGALIGTKKLTFYALVRHLGHDRSWLLRQMERHPELEKLVNSALEDSIDFAQRKIRMAIKRRSSASEPITLRAILDETSTHKHYPIVKNYILTQIELQGRALSRTAD